jgi:endoglucanase
MKYRDVKSCVVVSLAAMIGCAVSPSLARGQTFNYAEALQKSTFFYEAQISGPKPSWSRVTWRGDSAMQDGADVGVDLTGGWFDAGDHVKFGFAMASSAAMLAWGGVEYRSTFAAKGQLPHLLNNLRLVNDYFIKAHSAPNVLWGQVGEGDADHNFWGPAEVVSLKTPRRSFKIDMSCPGSDLAAETAAAMAASSIVFRPTDPGYANTLLTHARQLFSFAQATHPSFYVACVPGAPFYDSRFGNPNDEMTWAAIWLFRATNEPAFLTTARQLYATMCKENGTTTPCFAWSQSWNDKHFGAYVLMAKLTDEPQFHTDAQRWLDYWTVGIGKTTRTTPGGLMFVDGFGSLRYATNAALLAFVYADVLGGASPLYARYHSFAKKQVDYALGANPPGRSYMAGFGTSPPRNAHHRTGHGSWVNGGPEGVPTVNRHVLYGGMVAGPDALSDSAWADNRGNFRNTEVATDFNAGLTGALARLTQEFGGTPLANFPPVEVPDGPEIYVDAVIGIQASNFTEIRAFINNRSAWPARNLARGTLRYYFTLEPGVSPSQITVTSGFSQCGTGTITGPTQLTDRTYFVTASCVGSNIFPGGQSEHKREIVFRIASSGAWDASNDYSFSGLVTTGTSTTSRILLYDNGVRIWGDEPVNTPNFSLAATPSILSVVRQATANSAITVNPSGGFGSAVALSATGLPAGVTATFTPPSTTGASTLTLSASSTATVGPATVTVSGTGGGVTRTTSIALTVNPTQVADFSLSANPAAVSLIRGATVASAISLTRSGGFTSSVAFTTSALPAGVTATFTPASTTGANSSLTFAATATAAVGTSNVVVTATGGGLTRTTAISLTVGAGGGAGNGGLTVVPVITQNSPYFNDQAVVFSNTAPVTSLALTITVRRTPGIVFSGQYNTLGSQILQTNSSTTAAVTYVFTLAPGQTISAGSGRAFAAQTGGNGTAHPTADDTFSVTYTAGGESFTQSGHF